MKFLSVVRFLVLLFTLLVISHAADSAEAMPGVAPGNYFGFLPGPQPDVLLSVRLTKTGTFTGQIIKITSQDGTESAQSVRFSGKLDLDGAATVQPSPSNWTSVRLQYATNTSALAVYFTFSGIDYGPYILVQPPFSKQNPATAFSGRYTLAARCETDFDSQAGYGYFTALVTPSGTFRLSGRLPDGTPFAASRPVLIEGDVLLWSSVYKGSGHVAGVLNLSWLGGHVGWSKPPTASEPALAMVLDVAISKFTPPSKGFPVLPLPDRVDFVVHSADPNLAITNLMLMTGEKLREVESIQDWKMNRRTGVFSGTSHEVYTGRKVPIAGVVMQNRSAALGRCNNGTALSAVTLERPFKFSILVSGQPLSTFPMSFSMQVEGEACCPSWSFGDGTSSALGETVGHTFGIPGTHQVTATVYTQAHPEGIKQTVEVTIAAPP